MANTLSDEEVRNAMKMGAKNPPVLCNYDNCDEDTVPGIPYRLNFHVEQQNIVEIKFWSLDRSGLGGVIYS